MLGLDNLVVGTLSRNVSCLTLAIIFVVKFDFVSKIREYTSNDPIYKKLVSLVQDETMRRY